MADKTVVVGIAEMSMIRGSGKIATYALGSCVGVCLYDCKNKIAGMVHILLPSSSDAIERSNPYKFADSGCDHLLRRMVYAGAQQSFITAKIVGGATMFAVKGPMEGIGDRNVRAVKAALRALKVRIIAEDTGASYGRSVVMDAATGKLTIHTVGHGTVIL
ncbi:MAG: chemotaxis protein CheD [Enterocloster asparagiformis]|nr:chemotaxis protein CheD [Enterocloster asparagiformis]